MIQRAVIHVDGPPGVGKTTFVERLLHGVDDSVDWWTLSLAGG
jgi:nucleoside-triphosphatase THEP1